MPVSEDDSGDVPREELDKQCRVLPGSDAVERREIQQGQQYRSPERERSDTGECHGPEPADREREGVKVSAGVCRSQAVGVAPVW